MNDHMSWGERAKRLYHNRGLPLDEIEKVVSICFGGNLPEACKDCPLRQNGCSDRLEVSLFELLENIHSEEASKLIKNFEVCFSGGLPDRCWNCDFKGDACSKNRILQALNVIKEEEKKMINPCCSTNTISTKDVLNVLALFLNNGGYSDDELLYFVSVLTGISTDGILEAIQDNHLPDNSLGMNAVPSPSGLTRERVTDMFRSYVVNDAEAAERDYVQEALAQAGCGEEESRLLGLGWIWDN